jgi:acetate kinase
MSKIMVVNAGSSSLKFQLLTMPNETVLTSGVIERIGFEDAYFTIKVNGEKIKKVLPIKDHKKAVEILLDALLEYKIVSSFKEIEGIGHRVVNGGDVFPESIRVDDKIVAKVETLNDLAPLHNPAAIVGYRAFASSLPHAGNVFVFDTSFYVDMPKTSYMYATPYEWYEKYAVRKYGAHGTSHKYVASEAKKLFGLKDGGKIITCHIGNGASISAVKGDKCIDTSMGLTPLAGVMMGTRSGDIDPAIIKYICQKTGESVEEVTNDLNKKSGLLGVSGVSSDSRDVEEAANKGNERAILAQDLQVQTIVRYIGSYFVELGGCDAIVFTAGLGENNIAMREKICNKLKDSMGVIIDTTRNNVRGETRVISADNSKVKVAVIPTNEELVIARDTARLLNL